MEHQRVRLTVGDRELVLVGTAHISRESVEEVRSAILEEKPDRVCIELDDGRYTSMSQGSSWQNLNVGKVIREGKGFLLMANLVLASFQRRLGKDLGVKPGEEMLAAVTTAQELGIPFSLCDRAIQVTLRRAWGMTGAWGKMKLLSAMIASVFSSEKLGAEDIEKLKQKDVLASMMEELSEFLPAAKAVLIDERDSYLAAKILAAEGKKVLAVVGAGHMDGIIRTINEQAATSTPIDVTPLEAIPKRGLAGKIVPWTFPALIVVIFGLGFIRAGWTKGFELFLLWVVVHGGLAAIGSLLALAHPLTILVAFLGAPIGTFNPFGKIGLFTGLSEAFLKKPRVRDVENLTDDLMTFKGFYTNRVTHILMVFFLSTLGAAIGNLVAFPLLAAKLFGST
jgi:pheromone shutdown-related protein TraB